MTPIRTGCKELITIAAAVIRFTIHSGMIPYCINDEDKELETLCSRIVIEQRGLSGDVRYNLRFTNTMLLM